MATSPKTPSVRPLANNIHGKAIQAGISTPVGQSLNLLSEALETIQNTHDSLIADVNTPPAVQGQVSVKDQDGREVAFLGFKAASLTKNYGLTVFDLARNPTTFVGVQLEMPLTITSTTNGSPDVIGITGHPYVNGETLLIQGALGDTNINGIVIVENAAANTFQITDLLGNPINGNAAYTGGGTAARFFAGGKFQTISIGANDQIHAYADGRVVINGVAITLNANGITTTIGNLSEAAAGVAGLDVKNNAASSQDVLVTDKGFYIRATDQATYVASLSAPGASQGRLSLFKLSTTFAAILDSQLGLSLTDGGGNTGAVKATQLLLGGGTILADSTIPEIDVGAAGAAQSLVNSTFVRTQNSTNTRFVQISSGGSATGTDVGGTTWLISGTGVSGTDAVGTWSLNGSAVSIQGNQIVGPRLAAVTDVTLATTETAPAAYDATAISMLNHEKTDLMTLKTQVNLILARLRSHGLIS